MIIPTVWTRKENNIIPIILFISILYDFDEIFQGEK